MSLAVRVCIRLHRSISKATRKSETIPYEMTEERVKFFGDKAVLLTYKLLRRGTTYVAQFDMGRKSGRLANDIPSRDDCSGRLKKKDLG